MALGKSTAQSSTFNSSTATGVSGNAVDGNPDTDFQNGHCSHTNAANPSWWRVDLGEDHVPVSEIFIVNRFSSSSSSNLQQRNKNYTITLGEHLYIFRVDSWWYVYVYINITVSINVAKLILNWCCIVVSVSCT